MAGATSATAACEAFAEIAVVSSLCRRTDNRLHVCFNPAAAQGGASEYDPAGAQAQSSQQQSQNPHLPPVRAIHATYPKTRQTTPQ